MSAAPTDLMISWALTVIQVLIVISAMVIPRKCKSPAADPTVMRSEAMQI